MNNKGNKNDLMTTVNNDDDDKGSDGITNNTAWMNICFLRKIISINPAWRTPGGSQLRCSVCFRTCSFYCHPCSQMQVPFPMAVPICGPSTDRNCFSLHMQHCLLKDDMTPFSADTGSVKETRNITRKQTSRLMIEMCCLRKKSTIPLSMRRNGKTVGTLHCSVCKRVCNYYCDPCSRSQASKSTSTVLAICGPTTDRPCYVEHIKMRLLNAAII